MPPERGDNHLDAASVTLFIDRDCWSRVLDAALHAAGIPFVAHRDRFPHDTPDVEWIAEVGRRKWVIMTRDQNIRRRPNEKAAVDAAGVHLFALTSGNLSAAETARIIVQAWPHIQALATQQAPPAFWSVRRDGRVQRIVGV